VSAPHKPGKMFIMTNSVDAGRSPGPPAGRTGKMFIMTNSVDAPERLMNALHKPMPVHADKRRRMESAS
jgi:hypothetical protein